MYTFNQSLIYWLSIFVNSSEFEKKHLFFVSFGKMWKINYLKPEMRVAYIYFLFPKKNNDMVIFKYLRAVMKKTKKIRHNH